MRWLELPEPTSPDGRAFALRAPVKGEGLDRAPIRNQLHQARAGWRIPDSLLAVSLVILATAMRLFAIRTAFDLNDDEVYYTDLGQSLRHGIFPPRNAPRTVRSSCIHLCISPCQPCGTTYSDRDRAFWTWS